MMKRLISRLFADAKPLDNPIVKMLREERPARTAYLDCQIVLKGGHAMAGILTVDGEVDDVLRLVAVAQTPDKKVLLADHYFTYEEVQAIVLGRDLPEQLVKPVRNGGPIILGQ